MIQLSQVLSNLIIYIIIKMLSFLLLVTISHTYKKKISSMDGEQLHQYYLIFDYLMVENALNFKSMLNSTYHMHILTNQAQYLQLLSSPFQLLGQNLIMGIQQTEVEVTETPDKPKARTTRLKINGYSHHLQLNKGTHLTPYYHPILFFKTYCSLQFVLLVFCLLFFSIYLCMVYRYLDVVVWMETYCGGHLFQGRLLICQTYARRMRQSEYVWMIMCV